MSRIMYFVCDHCGDSAAGEKPENFTTADPVSDIKAPQHWITFEIGDRQQHACSQLCRNRIVLASRVE